MGRAPVARGRGQVWAAAPKEWRADNRNLDKVITAVALGTGALLCLVGLVVGLILLRPKPEPIFRGSVKEFLEPMRARNTLKPGELSGKMLVLDLDEGKIDPIHYRLPPSMRALSPGEVRVVARLSWQKIQAGSYVHQTGLSYPAMRWDCHIIVVDRGRGEGLSTVIRGTLPYQTDINKTEGPKPTDQVVRYLESLANPPAQ